MSHNPTRNAKHGGGGDGKRRRDDDDPDIRVSKSMTKILRHDAQRLGLNMTPDGFVRVDELLKLPGIPRNVDHQTVLRIVDGDAKKRFSVKTENSIMFIRANQGHTHSLVSATELLEKIENPSQVPICIHGTTWSAWETGIREGGLCRMKRNEIHCAAGEFDADTVTSGMRASSQVLIYIDIPKCLAFGVEIFRSENGVILFPGFGPKGFLPTFFFANVIDAKTRTLLPFVPNLIVMDDANTSAELMKRAEILSGTGTAAAATHKLEFDTVKQE